MTTLSTCEVHYSTNPQEPNLTLVVSDSLGKKLIFTILKVQFSKIRSFLEKLDTDDPLVAVELYLIKNGFMKSDGDPEKLRQLLRL